MCWTASRETFWNTSAPRKKSESVENPSVRICGHLPYEGEAQLLRLPYEGELAAHLCDD